MSMRTYWRMFLIMPIVLAMSAQVFTLLSESTLFLVLGVLIISFALLELSGFRGSISERNSKLEVVAAVTSGISGGLSGVWGPPIMVYLMAINVYRVQDRLDQKKFRKATLFVLLLAGLNLVRRGMV